mgnify:CR=1 FL=1
MGYKMKGSPAKLGSIEGTTGHASALKMASSPAKIGGIGGMIVNKVMKKAGKKLGKIMPKKGAAPAPGAAPAEAPAVETTPSPTKMYKKSPAKDSMMDVMEDSAKGKLDPPTKFWATVAKVAIGANKKRNANIQARDDAKNKGVQDAMSRPIAKI